MKSLAGFERCEFWDKCEHYDIERLACVGNLDAHINYSCSHYHYKKAKIKE